jgi:ADP-ribose pyrophosphatase
MSNPKKLVEKLLSSKKLFKGSFFEVTHDTVELPDGKTASREYIIHNGAVAIIAITNDNNIIIERQYRHPVRQIMLEIPAGKLEIDENPLEAAKRELSEETGFTAKAWIELGTCLPCIGYSSEKITYYLATELNSGSTNLDDGEFVETLTMPFNEFLDMVYNGEVTDTKTIAGIMLYQGYLRKNSSI